MDPPLESKYTSARCALIRSPRLRSPGPSVSLYSRPRAGESSAQAMHVQPFAGAVRFPLARIQGAAHCRRYLRPAFRRPRDSSLAGAGSSLRPAVLLEQRVSIFHSDPDPSTWMTLVTLAQKEMTPTARHRPNASRALPIELEAKHPGVMIDGCVDIFLRAGWG